MVADEETLAYLMRAAQSGDRQAYRSLLVEVQRWLQRYFRRRCVPGQIDDLVQEVLMAVHQKRASWDCDRPFLPWLAAIARYRWVDYLRGVYLRAEDALGDHDPAGEGEEDALVARLSLERMFVRIPEKQAELIRLVKIEGLSVREAADRNGLSESAVKVNIHRGLKKLSALIENAE